MNVVLWKKSFFPVATNTIHLELITVLIKVCKYRPQTVNLYCFTNYFL